MRGIRTLVVIGAFALATSGCTLYGFGANDLLFCWGGAIAGNGTNFGGNLPLQAEFDKWTAISIGSEFKIGIRSPS